MADDHDRAELASLRAEVSELRAQLANLTADVRRAQQHVDLTMRGQLRCRACGCQRIAHAIEVLDRGDSGTRGALSLYQASVWRSKTTGELEAYACTKCGLLEWYVKDPGALEEHEKYMRILDGTTPSAPYR